MSDITLTSGIRQNLLSLQQTSADLTTTQEALSTGKAVNSAADNPSAYFTSQNLTNTANSLSALLDQIGQGQQTIDAATNGLTASPACCNRPCRPSNRRSRPARPPPRPPARSHRSSGASSLPAARSHSPLARPPTRRDRVQLDASAIEAAINATTGLGSAGALTASDNGSGDLVLTANSAATSFTVGASRSEAPLRSEHHCRVYGTSSTRTTLQTNYNGLLTQINQLAGDASYNGVNLLSGNNLTIDFNPTGTSSLTINGVNFNATGLGLSTSADRRPGPSRTTARCKHALRRSTPRSRRCKPRPRRSAPIRASSEPVRRSKRT